MKSSKFIVSAVLTALAAGCGGESTPPTNPGTARVQIVSGGSGSDTIGAFLPPLVLQVFRADGTPPPVGTAVDFKSLIHSNRAEVAFDSAGFGGLLQNFSAQAVTDPSGRVSVPIEINIPGDDRAEISVPSLSLDDTVHYTGVPGHAVSIVVGPIDTLVHPGQSFTMRATVEDRFSNARTDAVVWSSAGAGGNVTSGGAVTASANGHLLLSATLPGTTITATSSVNVLQTLHLVAQLQGNNGLRDEFFDDDGANVHGGFVDRAASRLAWVPALNSLIYASDSLGQPTLFVADTSSHIRPLFNPAFPPGINAASDPSVSADGAWLYFIADDGTCAKGGTGASRTGCVYRAKLDGTSIQRVQRDSVVSAHPAASPDGTRVAVWSEDSDGNGKTRIIDASTGSAYTLPGGLGQPAWSPDGNWIATSNAGISLTIMHPDGTGARLFTGLPDRAFAAPDWTPDGRYIAISDGVWGLFDPNDGTFIDIPILFTRDALSFVVRP